ncbi:hypothetical protein [Hyphomonas sp.]|uniref:hypothetical protein n=1 Tax=Hyphomonas sp. TaxID=87 RepID=UPI000C9880DE|nr:hypothetical protein [Hyphomonas sp.]MAL46642.1 hypothetical protein [Hyphomonas sp.]|tara:strand:- start:156 stop:1052 length:897 start_codon:yes stop_codon:yes gene_type:complete
MAKARGHRANKPNDSFGTINNDSLYRGKHREDVYKDDDEDNEAEETVEAQEADPEEATPQQASSFVEQKQEPDHDYKKRYDDLKRHYDTKVNEFKQEIAELKTAMQSPQAQMPKGVAMPKTPEELQAFKDQYPEVFEVVQTVSSYQAESQVAELREELGTIKEREKELEKQKAYQQLLNHHPDFDEMKTDEKFLSWLEEQPESISDGIYKNNTDAKWAARVIDLYKADTSVPAKKKKTTKPSAADAVTRASAREVATAKVEGKVWKASEIRNLKPWEFEKLEEELDTARLEGRIDPNN